MTIQFFPMLNSIKYLIWDVDGTFYKSHPKLLQDIRREMYRRISEALGVSVDDAEKLFEECYRRLGGATTAIVQLGLSRRIVLEAVDAVDKTPYVKRDMRLKQMLEKTLSDYKHLVVTNTSKQGTLRTLEILGLEPDMFQAIITAEDVAHPKPDPEPFLRVLQITGAGGPTHLSVGDREAVDIVPAKRLDMRTMIVWGKSDVADYSVDSVYDVAKMLRQH